MVIEQVDAILKPLGFRKRGAVWNRSCDNNVDAIDVQISRNGDTYTLEAGVLNRAVHEVFWGAELKKFIEPPMCTVSARAGNLLYGTDKWWNVGDQNDAIPTVIATLLDFIDRAHTQPEMMQRLIETEVIKNRYPPPAINLAILKFQNGKPQEAQKILDDLRERISGPWLERVAQIENRLGLLAR